MKTTEVIFVDGRQVVALPDDFQFGTDTVSIRKDGNRVILEPLSPNEWPVDFLKSIHIEDAAFARPIQGKVPPVPSFGSE